MPLPLWEEAEVEIGSSQASNTIYPFLSAMIDLTLTLTVSPRYWRSSPVFYLLCDPRHFRDCVVSFPSCRHIGRCVLEEPGLGCTQSFFSPDDCNSKGTPSSSWYFVCQHLLADWRLHGSHCPIPSKPCFKVKRESCASLTLRSKIWRVLSSVIFTTGRSGK